MLRSATLTDLAEVASWIATARDCELWAGWRLSFPIDPQRLRAAIEFSDTNSFCLQRDRRVVAFGQIINKGNRAHLARLIVDPSYRRQGHGKRLIESLLERIRQDGYERVSLNVDESNGLAASLYVTLGFRDAASPPDELQSTGTRYMERVP